MSLRQKGIRLALILVSWAVGATTVAQAQGSRPVFLGPDDRPLPTQDVDEILDFLATASEISSEELGVGITGARRLVLAKDAFQVRVVFHHIDENEQKTKRLPNDRIVSYVRDSYTSQVAAFRVARLLGVRNVPPTVLRRSNGLRGSVQLWIEGAMMEKERQERGIEPPDYTLWNQLYADMRVFDNLINNIDRNTGNMLVDAHGYLWLIDHTRSFGRDRSLPQPETLTRCSRSLYLALQELDRESVEASLEDLLSPGEIRAIFRRRDALLAKLRELIEKRGEASVLFDYGDPDPGIQIVDDGETE